MFISPLRPCSGGPLTRVITRAKSSDISTLLLTGSYGSDGNIVLSQAAQHVNSKTDNHLLQLINVNKIEKTRTFYGLSEEFPIVNFSVINQLKDDGELRNNYLEAVRLAIGYGVTALKSDVKDISEIVVDSSGFAKTVAEAATLSNYVFNELKSEKKADVEISQFCQINLPDRCNTDWSEGVALGNSQNFSRYLMEMPANHLTPKLFVDRVKTKLAYECTSSPIDITVHDESWLLKQGMGAFLSVARGSSEPPFLLELRWNGGNGDSAPVILVGKGVTFDSGGISIKPSKGMDKMRADMGGAACAVGAIMGAAKLNLPCNIIALTPLCENMPSGSATKPGDVVTAKNGKTIQIDNTDAEGRLILADTLTYADTFSPSHCIDIATLTGAMVIALGGVTTGVFSNNTELWNILDRAGAVSGDRLWRLPLYTEYGELLKSPTADVNNISREGGAGSITAAKFLEKFTTCSSWAHLDIAGVMEYTNSLSYLPKGMSGRPTRTLIEALKLISVS